MVRSRKLVTIYIMSIASVVLLAIVLVALSRSPITLERLPTNIVEASGEGCRIYRTANYSITTATWLSLPWTGEHWDTGGYHAASSTDIGMGGSENLGKYLICCNLLFSTNTTGVRGVRIRLNDNRTLRIAGSNATAGVRADICTTWSFTATTDYVECEGYQDSGSTLNILAESGTSGPIFEIARFTADDGVSQPTCTPAPTATPVPTATLTYYLYHHHTYHEAGGSDQITVTNLTGLLADRQDAGWFTDLPVTTTGIVSGQVLAWNGSRFQPYTITLGATMSDVITATISGTVTVIISDATRYTETLTSGHQIAVLRSFSYGEASIAIGLFLMLAMIALVTVFWFVRR